jgi:hypothetical protein
VSTHTTSLRRVVSFTCGVAVGLFLLTGVASAAPPDHSHDTSPQPASKADFSGNGANTHGSYDSTRDGSPSGNGNGGGEAKGKPCAGCVGKADNKNPKGQAPDGSDHNRGYECDTNHGIGRSNPAHTGCRTTSAPAVNDDDTNTGPSNSDTTPPSVVSGGSDDNDNATKPACAGNDDSGDCAHVMGTDLERADTVSIAGVGTAHLVELASANTGQAAAAVLGAHAERGLGAALAFTGAGVDVLTLALVGLALLATGLVLVRRTA